MYTAIGTCHASYVECVLAVNITSMTYTYCCVYGAETADGGQ